MNKLFTRISMALVGIAMAVGVGVAADNNVNSSEVKADAEAYYSLVPYEITSDKTNQSSSYSAPTVGVSCDGIDWHFEGNTTFSNNYWRVGGKDTSATNRLLYNTTALAMPIDRIVFSYSGLMAAKNTTITINSLTLEVFSDVTLETSIAGPYVKNTSSTLTHTAGGSASTADGGTLEFVPNQNENSWAKDSFYCFTVNYQVSTASNSGLNVSGIDFYAAQVPTKGTLSINTITGNSLKEGATGTFEYTIADGYPASLSSTTWTSTNTDVVEVNSSTGFYRAKSAGNTTIKLSGSNENFSYDEVTYAISVTAFDGYTLVEKAGDLEVGATYFMGRAANNAIASSTISGGYLTKLSPGVSDGSFAQDGKSFSGNLPTGTLLFSILQGPDGYYLTQLSDSKSLKRASTTTFGYTTTADLSDAYSVWSITFLQTTTYGNYEIGSKSTGHVLYNTSSPRFKPYTSDATASMLYPELFKKSGSTYRTDANTFATNSLHMGDPDYAGSSYSGSDTSVTCAGNYAAMKTAYSSLSVFAKSVLQYSAEFGDARARMTAWATANGQTFTYGSNTPFALGNMIELNKTISDSTTLVIIVISAISLIAVSSYFVIRRRKENN